MAVDVRAIEVALVKVVRATIGSDLTEIVSNVALWDTNGIGFVQNPNHIFTAATTDAATVLRDNYFVANPTELVIGVTCTLNATDTQAIKQVYTNAKPAVIRSRIFSSGSTTTPTFPDYPYASVDYTRITDEGYELSERLFNTAGDYIYRTHKIASYSIRIYGTSDNDVTMIADKMHMMFETDGVRAMLATLAPNEARVRSKNDIVFVASNMEDKYREIASFDINLAVLDEVVIPVGADGNDVIENVEFTTTIPQSGVQGGIDVDGDGITDLDISVQTTVTYP